MARKNTGVDHNGLPATDGKSHDQDRHLDILKKLRVVIRAAQRHSQWIEKQCGITGAQLWVMQELHETPGMRVGEIALRMAIHQTTASNLLDALEKRGYINKTRDHTDQRAVKLALSEAGGAILLTAPKPARGLLTTALSQLDNAALAQLDGGLNALLGSIGDLDEGFGLQPMPFMM
ncbi:MAG TPA: MarR family transcriptional regulator [Paucimonas sp.]|nr:MarR family transcriptional regulator [Paucimonas sp.]HJW55259.1 MarR family transcriptional regulator [Burkholderiaceae bacterium]